MGESIRHPELLVCCMYLIEPGPTKDTPQESDKSTVMIHLESLPGSQMEGMGVFSNMRGASKKTPVLLKDPIDGKRKLFFIFDDISIRAQSAYQIVCVLVDLARYS